MLLGDHDLHGDLVHGLKEVHRKAREAEDVAIRLDAAGLGRLAVEPDECAARDVGLLGRLVRIEGDREHGADHDHHGAEATHESVAHAVVVLDLTVLALHVAHHRVGLLTGDVVAGERSA